MGTAVLHTHLAAASVLLLLQLACSQTNLQVGSGASGSVMHVTHNWVSGYELGTCWLSTGGMTAGRPPGHITADNSCRITCLQAPSV